MCDVTYEVTKSVGLSRAALRVSCSNQDGGILSHPSSWRPSRSVVYISASSTHLLPAVAKGLMQGYSACPTFLAYSFDLMLYLLWTKGGLVACILGLGMDLGIDLGEVWSAGAQPK
ncbi:hypothetical protein BGZ63DRAFT_398288 [Mariannaea sp. PMI_226]|nr:hypothetical protein BGZ63DRAFT_398288 [Mariannaea sp. PMI_226]